MQVCALFLVVYVFALFLVIYVDALIFVVHVFALFLVECAFALFFGGEQLNGHLFSLHPPASSHCPPLPLYSNK